MSPTTPTKPEQILARLEKHHPVDPKNTRGAIVAWVKKNDFLRLPEQTLVPSRARFRAPAPGTPHFVSAPMDPVQQQSRIGKADLDQARALLFQARKDLEPRQWEALEGKLTAAERAFERFSQATKAGGQAAEVVRGAEGLAQAGRARTWVEVLPRVGPLLVFLVLLYPSSTAGPEIDRRPEWVDAQGEYEARLRELAEESRRLMEERVTQDAEPDFDSAPFMAAGEPKTWRNTVDPATGRFYTSVEEYDRVPRYPDQTCKNSRLDTLRRERDALYTAVPPLIRSGPIRRTKDGIRRYPAPGSGCVLQLCLKLLEATNCASGHPMAGT